MKNKIFIIAFLLSHYFAALSQQPHTLAPFVGTWKATGLSLPMTFSYSKETKKFTPLLLLQKKLENDADTETKKSVEEFKKSLPALLETINLEIADNNLYVFSVNDKKTKGYCKVFDPIQTPGPETDEQTFIEYVENYDYNGGFKLYDNSTKSIFFANLKINNNDTTIVLLHGETMVGFSIVKYIYTLKKIKDEYNPTGKTLFDKRIKSERLYAKDIAANCTIINADTSRLIGYSFKKDLITFYLYTPGSILDPTIYFDVNNNNKVDALVDRFYRNFRDKLQNFYIEGGVAPAKRVWDYGNNVLAITYPISEISQSNVIAFQVAYKNWEEEVQKEILVPSRKDEVDFKKKNLFYITTPQ